MLKLNILTALLAVAAPAVALWPQPRQLSTGTTPLKLSSEFDIKLSGVSSAPRDLLDAIKRAKSQLKGDKHAILTPDRGAAKAGAVKAAKSLKSLTVSYTEKGKKATSISEEASSPLESRQEGYTLNVPADGSTATLSANSTLGLFRGLTTFVQIWYDLQGTSYTLEAPFQITDSPLYVNLLPSPHCLRIDTDAQPYRGLLLDTARN